METQSRGRSQAVRGRQGLRRREDPQGDRPAHPRRRVHGLRRPQRLRQEHAAAHDRGARRHHRRRVAHRQPGRQRRAPGRARHLDGVSELCAVPAHGLVRQHGLRLEAGQGAESRDRIERAAGGQDPAYRSPAATQAERPVGRPAPACGDRPRHRAQARGVLVRRALEQPRHRAAREDALRVRQAARAVQDDDGLCHARPGGGDDARRPHRRAASRSHRTGGLADGAV
jgi:hypothetical protein